MGAPLKIAATVTIDPSQAKVGAKETQAAISGIGVSATDASTKLQRLIETSVGIGGSAANNNIREWSGALAMAGRSADELRAKYNPLFAVISQYKQNVIEIRTLTAQGVLSTDEMTAAIQRQRQATLASIDAIKGRNAEIRAGGTGGNNFAATNAMFQFQDIAMTSAMGMNPLMVGLQQGSQLAGGFAGMTAKEAGAAVLGGITGLLSPISLITVGLTAATAAAIQFGSSMMESSSKTEKLDDVLQTHADLLKRLEERYGTLIDKAKGYGAESSRILAVSSSADLRALSRVSTTAGLDFFNEVGVVRNNVRGGGDFAVDAKYAAFAESLKKLREEAKAGKPDFEAFYDTLGRVAETNPQFAKQADELAKLVAQYRDARQALEELKRIREALFNDRGPNGLLLSQGTTAQGDRNASGLFEIQQAQEAKRTAQALAAQVQEIEARTVAEKVAAAKATAAAQYNDTETPDVRRTRIENAGILAQTQAEKELADAKRDRMRSIDETLAGARLELTLIGQTTSSMEAQRMELRLLTEAKTAAEKAGTTVSADEIERIKQAAAEYGRLQEAIKATNILRDQADSLQQLRLEISLIGQSEAARSRALALAQAEKQIRDQGITATSQQAQQIRANAAAMADESNKLDRLHDAWNTLQSTGENAIDAIGDAIRTGDWAGAINSVIADIEKSFITLGFTNPLKNVLFGTNLGTLSDAGGLIGNLFGGAGVSSMTTSSIGAMNVNAASVIINGGIAGGGLTNSLTSGLSGLAANDNIQAIYRQAIKNIESSGGNYGALGPVTASGDRAYGAYQVMGNNVPSWTKSALGYSMTPSQFLGSPSAQDAVFDKVFGGYVGKYGPSGAAQAWFGGPGSVGGSGLGRDMLGTSGNEYVSRFNADVSKMSTSFKTASSASDALGRGMFGANDATNKLGSGLNSASNGLNQLGTGLDQFGQALASARSGGNSGLADLLGSFTKVGIGAFNSSAQFQSAVLSGIPGLWADGGFTGNIDEKSIAGYVHGGEFVFSKRAVDKIGLGALDAMHRQARAGYASGGYVTASANDNAWGAWATQSQGQPAGTAAAPVINVINRNGSAVKVRDRSTANGVALDVMIDEAVADKVSQIGSNTGRAMQSQFGLNRGLSRR